MYHHDGGINGIAEDLRNALDESLHLRLNLELYNSNGIKPPTPDPVAPTPTPKQEVKAEKKSSLTNTPLMQQYQEMKKKHPDAVLLFRVGDFYEIFGEDAVKASEILGITLTRRANGSDKYIGLAGFPHHALDAYLRKLVRAGQRVAICEQLEDPKLTKTAKQKVVEIVTPNAEIQKVEQSESVPSTPIPEQAKEIETDGGPDYSDNPDPHLFAYNLFGELEPRDAPKHQRPAVPKKEKEEKPVEKPKPWADAKPLPTNKFRPLTDKELEFYGSLNWDDNPPINGFYEAMMSIAYAQLAERERQAAEKEADKDYKSETIVEGGTVIEKTEGYFIPGRQPIVEAKSRNPSRYVTPSFLGGYSVLPPQRQYGGAGRYGGLPLGSPQEQCYIQSIGIEAEQAKRAMLYVTLSETYQQLYNYEAETHEPSEHLREHLNQYYDEFVEKYGNLNEKKNVKFILMDANGRDALALERGARMVGLSRLTFSTIRYHSRLTRLLRWIHRWRH